MIERSLRVPLVVGLVAFFLVRNIATALILAATAYGTDKLLA